MSGDAMQRIYVLREVSPEEQRRAGVALAQMVLDDDQVDDKTATLRECLMMLGLAK